MTAAVSGKGSSGRRQRRWKSFFFAVILGGLCAIAELASGNKGLGYAILGLIGRSSVLAAVEFLYGYLKGRRDEGRDAG
jgi:hypothetical protein